MIILNIVTSNQQIHSSQFCVWGINMYKCAHWTQWFLVLFCLLRRNLENSELISKIKQKMLCNCPSVAGRKKNILTQWVSLNATRENVVFSAAYKSGFSLCHLQNEDIFWCKFNQNQMLCLVEKLDRKGFKSPNWIPYAT